MFGRTPEQVAAAHHVRTVARRGDVAATAKAKELKAEADAAARRRAP